MPIIIDFLSNGQLVCGILVAIVAVISLSFAWYFERESRRTFSLSEEVTLQRTKGNAVCVATASWVATLNGNLVQTTLATAPDVGGPWLQAYESSTVESGSMSNAFNHPAQTTATYYMNGRNLGGSSVLMENTRIWVICAKGALIPVPLDGDW